MRINRDVVEKTRKVTIDLWSRNLPIADILRVSYSLDLVKIWDSDLKFMKGSGGLLEAPNKIAITFCL